MNLIKKAADWLARNGYYRMSYMLFGWGASADMQITYRRALTVSTVYACTEILGSDCARLPLGLYQSDGETRRPRRDHPLHTILHDSPNPSMTAFTFRKLMTQWYINSGNAYAEIYRTNGLISSLWPLLPEAVEPVVDGRRIVEYIVTDKAGSRRVVKPENMFHLRGFTLDGNVGVGIIMLAQQSISLAAQQQAHGTRFYSSGARIPGIIKVNNPFLNDEEAKKFREDWERQYSGEDAAYKHIILDGDVDFKPLGVSAKDMQWLEGREFSVEEICRWYRISPHKLQDLRRATYSNIEHLDLEHVKHTLGPHLVNWEQEIALQLLTPRERADGLYAKHNVDGLLRGDVSARWAAYSTALDKGVLSVDEVRRLEDLNPLPNGAGAAHHIQLAQQTLPGTGEPTASERAALAKVTGEAR